jgi:hypothetical protein
MRCYLVTAKANDDQVLGRRIASTNADARAVREDLMETFGVKKKDVEIENHEVPVAKPDLLSYINDLLAHNDITIEEQEADD